MSGNYRGFPIYPLLLHMYEASLVAQMVKNLQCERSGLPFPSPGDLLNPGIESTSPASPALAGRFFTTEPPEKSLRFLRVMLIPTIALVYSIVCYALGCSFGVSF